MKISEAEKHVIGARVLLVLVLLPFVDRTNVSMWPLRTLNLGRVIHDHVVPLSMDCVIRSLSIILLPLFYPCTTLHYYLELYHHTTSDT